MPQAGAPNEPNRAVLRQADGGERKRERDDGEQARRCMAFRTVLPGSSSREWSLLGRGRVLQRGRGKGGNRQAGRLGSRSAFWRWWSWAPWAWCPWRRADRSGCGRGAVARTVRPSTTRPPMGSRKTRPRNSRSRRAVAWSASGRARSITARGAESVARNRLRTADVVALLRGAVQALGRRADHRLAQPMPPLGQERRVAALRQQLGPRQSLFAHRPLAAWGVGRLNATPAGIG